MANQWESIRQAYIRDSVNEWNDALYVGVKANHKWQLSILDQYCHGTPPAYGSAVY